MAPTMDTAGSGWNQLNREPKQAKYQEMKSFLQHLDWLTTIAQQMPSLDGISTGRRQQYFLEARSLHANSARELKSNKRYALAVVLIQTQRQHALDRVADLFIKKMLNLKSTAELRLQQYHLDQTKRTEKLIGRFRDVLNAFRQEEQSSDQQLRAAITAAIKSDSEKLVEECDAYMAYASNNFWPFMLASYHQSRSLLFNCISALDLGASTQDESLVRSIRFILEHRHSHKEWISIEPRAADGKRNQVNLQWLPEQWRKLVTGHSSPSAKVTHIHRKYYEMFVFMQIQLDLTTGDLVVRGSDKYSDYREQLMDETTYEEQIGEYGELVSLPVEPKAFVAYLKQQLSDAAQQADQRFPDNEYLELTPKGPVIRKHETDVPPPAVQALVELLHDRMKEVSILDLLVEAESWLDLHKLFGPISGFDAKVDDPRLRYILTLFCFGCNLGPSQVSQSVKGLSRKQLAWLNLKHVTEERLDKAIVTVVNAYNRFALPKHWGTGKSASADGTKWNLYEQNLLSEYHIRYGGYGGIGYYHVSDQYIALFSRFIPCGVYEATYILDIIQNCDADIQPDTLHGDTQSQSTPVFALAYLLGIQLMPRIRGIKKLTFFRPDSKVRYKHIDALFAGSINWELIVTHLPDMYRIVLSIKAGKLAPSAILRRLGTQSRKNKLYFAFRELGRVVRTIYLLKYINDVELRKVVHAATNKGEQFNNFTKWLFFGNDSIIAENIRYEQSKIIKYNQLVANLAILHNVASITQILKQLQGEGHNISAEAVAGLGPYWTNQINRFGSYTLDLKRKIPPPDYDIGFLNERQVVDTKD
jgi:TnpA family transposase